MISIPVTLVGPGSQPQPNDEPRLDYPVLPSGMDTYRMPAIDNELSAAPEAVALLESLQRALAGYIAGEPGIGFALDQLDTAALDLVNQVLGEGEVSIRAGRNDAVRIQESVLAGIWRVREYRDGQLRRDRVEVADIPTALRELAFADAADEIVIGQRFPEGVCNAPPVLVELNEHLGPCRAGAEPHVINLTLLPQTDADLSFLDAALGRGRAVILSRGYGNCRITATGTRHVWWVQYFNSQDSNILNSLEVSKVPAVACAAAEDICDSAARLAEILEVYR